ncbi:MAG: efflux RND transporter permease subunit, partial [Spirochaetales bacterium]
MRWTPTIHDERRTQQGFLDLRLFTPGGGRLPLREAATVRPAQGLERITRTGGKRSITVTAEVDEEVNNAERILAELQQDAWLHEQAAFADVKITAVGEAEETRQSVESLQRIFPVSMLLIYLMLATLFRSYL